jgi:uncharacterized protein
MSKHYPSRGRRQKNLKYAAVVLAAILLVSSGLLLVRIWENYQSRLTEFGSETVSSNLEYKGKEYELKEDIETVCKQYEDLATLMLEKDEQGKPFTFYHYMIDLTGGPCIYKRISGCGSGTEYMAVTPWGDLYPCHQFVGDEKFKLGDVFTGVHNLDIQNEFLSCNVYAREDCKDCWAKLYCSGGCAANAYHSTGSIKGVYKDGCTLFKKRMECAIMVAIVRALKGKN